MFDVLQSAWAEVRDTIAAVPDNVKTVLLTAVSIALALVIARIADTVLRRALAVRHPFLYSLLLRMEGPLRLALVLLALNVAVAAAPLDPTLALWLGYLLRVAFIAMVGWMLLGALNIATDIYLRRFDIEADDNLLARKQVTQVRILKGAISTTIVVITVAAALMTFEAVRQYGVSLFASAGIAGIVVGLAARPMLSNLIAGVQLAITQPIRLDDAVLVENEMGFVEEITSTYVVVRLWDWRRMVVPLTYFIERPFQNWTRDNSALIGTVLIRTDYTVPVDRVRAKVDEILKASKLWDGRVSKVQVTDSDDRSMELRILASARNSGATFDMRCEIREQLIDFLQCEYPLALPRARQEMVQSGDNAGIEQRESRQEGGQRFSQRAS